MGARDIGNMVISHNIAISAAKWPADNNLIQTQQRQTAESAMSACWHIGIPSILQYLSTVDKYYRYIMIL